MYQVYWRNEERRRHWGYVRARTADEAYDFAAKKLRRGCTITAVYKASEHQITPRSICLNFDNPAEYKLF